MKDRYILAINEGDYGSTGLIAESILNGAKSLGLKPLFGVFEKTKNNDFTISLSSNRFNNFANRLLCRIDGSDGFHNIKATRDFLNSISNLDIAIIHLHNIHGRYVNLELIFQFAREKNAKIVWTLHDCWMFTGRCAHFELADCFRWRELCGKCPTRCEYPASYFCDKSKKYLEKKTVLYKKYEDLITVVCPSNWLHNYLVQSKVGFLKSKVIHNGIERIEGAAEGDDKIDFKNKKVFISVAAGFDKRKGFEYINKLADELDPDKFVFIVAGMPPSKHKEISKHILNLGYVNDRQKLNYYYSISDALINPTLEDTFPTINLEALSQGIPVITFDTGGSPECLNSSCGIVVQKGSYSKLKNTVETFKKGLFSRENCIKQSELFSKKNMCSEYMNLFKEILK